MGTIDNLIDDEYMDIVEKYSWGKTWDDFLNITKERKVILYGIGEGAEIYFHKYGNVILPELIIDQNKLLLGKTAYQTISECTNPLGREIRIFDSTKLDSLDNDCTVILIASLRRYVEIALELENRGVKCFFSVFVMEFLQHNMKPARKKDGRRFLEESLHEVVDPNKICILTWVGDLCGHGKEIVRQLKNLCQDLDVVWLIKDWGVPEPEGIRVVWRNNKRLLFHEIETAKILLFDDNALPTGIIKKKGQIYIQMKHWSSITLKMFGYDEARYRNDSKMMEKMCPGSIMDYVIVGSDFDEQTCRSGFNYTGKVIYAGSPRSDILFNINDSILQSLRDQYSLSEKTRYLLYAPTYRLTSKGWDEVIYRSDMDFSLIKDCLEKRFGGEWGILLRLHPFVAAKSKNISRPDYVIDVSDYYDSQELVALAEVLVTDYSSIMFEPAYVGKPVFLLATDRERFLDIERGFLLDYNELPFPRAASNDELVVNIQNFRLSDYLDTVNAFLQKYGVHEDGHAAERVAQFVLQLLDKSDEKE